MKELYRMEIRIIAPRNLRNVGYNESQNALCKKRMPPESTITSPMSFSHSNSFPAVFLGKVKAGKRFSKIPAPENQ